MRVRLKPDRFYRAFVDPWSIGDATSSRYDRYRELVLEHATARERMLDIGCGYAAFLARFRDDFAELSGLDASRTAIAGAKERHPDLSLFVGSADAPPQALSSNRYDAILLSDVIYYLPDRKRRAVISWIADHLGPDGVALIAAWVPGGRYLTHDELTRLVDAHLVIEHYELLETGHLVLIARPRRTVVALTVDYETWQPIPEGRTIDWARDVFQPTEALLAAATRAGVPVTLMAEMGEYFWLRQHDPPLAEVMREQWRAAVQAGHDVQLHLHPSWLPHLGARHENGRWHWDPSFATAADYPGDLIELISCCRRELEDVIRTVKPRYRVCGFRAGTYEAQPFERLHEALVANDILCDSSVLPGDHRPDRRYDYRHAYALSGAWRANQFDPQLRAPDGQKQLLLELPVCSVTPGVRWTFDGDEGGRFVGRLKEARSVVKYARRGSSEVYRLRRSVAGRLGGVRWPGARSLVRCLALPQHPPAGDDIFVLVGHTKADLNVPAIERGLARLAADSEVECSTLSHAVGVARAGVRNVITPPEPAEQRAACADALCRLMPLDRDSIGVICDGTSDTRPFALAMPWARLSTSPRLKNAEAVVLDSGLEGDPDPDRMLAAATGRLRADGVLLCRAWADGRAGWRAPGASAYAPTRDELASRLRAAGFAEVEVREVDAARILRLPYRPEAEGRLLLARAWRQERDHTARIHALLKSVYDRVAPDRRSDSEDPLAILAGGHAWCAGYAAILAEALRREGYPSRRATLIAHEHPRGRGSEQRESHEVLEVWDGARLCVLDPMAGVVFQHPLSLLLRNPALARPGRPPDRRWSDRRYDLYATDFFYRRVVSVGIRKDPAWPPRDLPPARVPHDIPHHRGMPYIDYRPLPSLVLRAWWAWHDSTAHAYANRVLSGAMPLAWRTTGRWTSVVSTGPDDEVPAGMPAEPVERARIGDSRYHA